MGRLLSCHHVSLHSRSGWRKESSQHCKHVMEQQIHSSPVLGAVRTARCKVTLKPLHPCVYLPVTACTEPLGPQAGSALLFYFTCCARSAQDSSILCINCFIPSRDQPLRHCCQRPSSPDPMHTGSAPVLAMSCRWSSLYSRSSCASCFVLIAVSTSGTAALTAARCRRAPAQDARLSTAICAHQH